MRNRFCRALVLAFLTAVPVEAALAADFNWMVHDRPPFRVWNKDGTVTGLFVEQAKKAFDGAGISYAFKRSTASRTQQFLKQNKQPVCSTGWFKTAERAAYALYSEPFYQGSGTGALVRKDHNEALWHKTFASLLADNTLKVGLRRGWSYGKFFDGLLKQHATPNVQHTQTNAGSAAMLMGGRFDYLLVSVDTADFLMKSVTGGVEKLTLMKMQDSPPGELRYIMCSKNVGDAFMKRLNAAIKKLQLVKPKS